jgi:hypothetical protein
MRGYLCVSLLVQLFSYNILEADLASKTKNFLLEWTSVALLFLTVVALVWDHAKRLFARSGRKRKPIE